MLQHSSPFGAPAAFPAPGGLRFGQPAVNAHSHLQFAPTSIAPAGGASGAPTAAPRPAAAKRRPVAFGDFSGSDYGASPSAPKRARRVGPPSPDPVFRELRSPSAEPEPRVRPHVSPRRGRPVGSLRSQQPACPRKRRERPVALFGNDNCGARVTRPQFRRRVRQRRLSPADTTALVSIAPDARQIVQAGTPIHRCPFPTPSRQGELILYTGGSTPVPGAGSTVEEPESTVLVEEVDEAGNAVRAQVELPAVPDTSVGEAVPEFFTRPGSPRIEVVSTSPVLSPTSGGVVVEELDDNDEQEDYSRWSGAGAGAGAGADHSSFGFGSTSSYLEAACNGGVPDDSDVEMEDCDL